MSDAVQSLATQFGRLAAAASTSHDGSARAALMDRIVSAQTAVARRRSATAGREWLSERRTLLREALGVDVVPLRERPADTLVRELRRDGVTIEKRVLDVLGDAPIPVDVYRPDTQGPWPLVLHMPGHWIENGRLAPDLQRNAFALASSGMLVAVVDPLDQGERFSGWHVHAQPAPLLAGITQTGIMLAEHAAVMRHLATRPDVDQSRRAVTGASGGGLQSLYFPIVDEHLAAVVPVCYVVDLPDLLLALDGVHWNSDGDLCNQVPGLADTVTIADVVALAAPTAFCAISATEDPQFPISAARKAIDEARQICVNAATPHRLDFVEVAGPHAYGWEATVAAHDFLREVFGLRPAHCRPVPDAALQTVPCPIDYLGFSGSPFTTRHQSLQPDWDSTARVLDEVCDGREKVVALARAALETTSSAVMTTPANEDVVRAAFGLYDPAPVSGAIRRTQTYGTHRLEMLELMPEAGTSLDAFLVVATDPQPTQPLLLAFGQDGAAAALDELDVGALVAAGWAVAASDLRGQGRHAGVEFDLASLGLFLKRHLFAQRAADIRAALTYFFDRNLMAPRLDRSRIVLAAVDAPTELLVSAVATTDVRAAGACAFDRYEEWVDCATVDPTVPTWAYVPGIASRLTLSSLRQLPRAAERCARSELADWLTTRFGKVDV
jgi:hypothetical protein